MNLLKLFMDKTIDFLFVEYKDSEKEMFKLLTQNVLEKLGVVALDQHQFSNPNEDKPYHPSTSQPPDAGDWDYFNVVWVP